MKITDNDASPTISLSSGSRSVGEDAGSVTVTVRLGASSGQKVTVDYGTANGTASSGSDYTAVSGTLTFLAGQTSKTVSVAIADDSIDEPNEAFSVSLSNPSNATLGSTASSTVTITDNDAAPTVTLSLSASSMYEGDSVTATAGLSHPSSADTEVLVLGNGGQVSDDALTIPAGEMASSGSLPLQSLDNRVDEPDRDTVISGKASNAFGIAGDPDDVILTLKDNDEPSTAVALSVSPSTIAEDAGPTMLRVTALFDRSARVDATPIALMVGGTPATLTIPYRRLDGMLEFEFTPADDEVDGPDVTVDITGTHADLPVSGAALTVKDDEVALTLSLSASNLAEDAGATALTVTGTLEHTRSEDTVVPLTVTAGAGTEADDFTAVPSTLRIPADTLDATASVTLTPADDAVVEGPETVMIGGTAAGIIVTPAEVTISDDDLPSWAVSLAPTSTHESGGSSTLAIATGGVTYEGDETLTLMLGGTAVAGTDYSISAAGKPLSGPPYSLTLSAGSSSVQARITALADKVPDPDETVTVEVRHDGAAVGSGSLTLTEGVCARTPAVRDALAEAAGVSDCAAVGATALAGITALDFSTRNLSSLTLQSDDFSGLSGIKTLGMGSIGLSALPSGVFSGLTRLTGLNLSGNRLTQLSADIFSELKALQVLNLSSNRLSALPAGA